jgi:hypothetical protein
MWGDKVIPRGESRDLPTPQALPVQNTTSHIANLAYATHARSQALEKAPAIGSATRIA